MGLWVASQVRSSCHCNFVCALIIRGCADKAGIQFHVLNRSKGAAVWVRYTTHPHPTVSHATHRDPEPRSTALCTRRTCKTSSSTIQISTFALEASSTSSSTLRPTPTPGRHSTEASRALSWVSQPNTLRLSFADLYG